MFGKTHSEDSDLSHGYDMLYNLRNACSCRFEVRPKVPERTRRSPDVEAVSNWSTIFQSNNDTKEESTRQRSLKV